MHLGVQPFDSLMAKPEGAGFKWAGDSITTDKILNEPIAIGLRKNNPELKAAADQAINAMVAEGVMQKLAEEIGKPEDIFNNPQSPRLRQLLSGNLK